MSWITIKLLGYRLAAQAGLLRPQRGILNFIGATVEDDEENKRTNITFTGTGLVEVTGEPPIVVTDNPDPQHIKVAISAATTSNAGSLSAADKQKLDALPADIATETYVDDAITSAISGLGGAPETAQYLLKGSTVPAELPNGVAAGDLAGTFFFVCDADAPLCAYRADASNDTALTALKVHRISTGGAAVVGLGARVTFAGQDAAGDEPDLAHLDAVLTDVTAGAHRAKFVFWAANGLGAGDDARLGEWDPAAGLTVRRDAVGAADSDGLTLLNDTETTGVVTEQRPPGLRWKGHGRNTSGGGSDVPVEVRIRPVFTAAASNPTVDLYFQRQLAGGGWLTYAYFTSALPSFGGVGLYTQNTILLASPSNGLRIDQGGGAFGGIKASSNHLVVESQGAANRLELWGALAVGTAGDVVRIHANAGTRSAGNLLAAGDGSTYGQRWAVQWDGATITPRVIAAPSTPTSSGGAVTFNLSSGQHVELAISENTTVTITGGSRGQKGLLVFKQDGVGRTITMPTASGTIVYDTVLSGLGVSAMVNNSPSATTVLNYYITTDDKLLIFGGVVTAT